MRDPDLLFSRYESTGREQDRARVEFLRAVEEIEPRVLQKLADTALGSYRAWNARVESPEQPDVDIDTARAATSACPETDPDLHACVTALRAWGERWGLDQPWCFAVAADTLLIWSAEESSPPTELRWHGSLMDKEYPYLQSHSAHPRFPAEAITLEWPQVPGGSRLPDLITAFQKEVGRELRKHLLPPKPRKIGDTPELFVRVHVARERVKAIAPNLEVDDSTALRRRLMTYGNFIGLPLRPGKPGRPAKGGRSPA